MPDPLRLISSMATRTLVADLVAAWHSDPSRARVVVESVGGVDAARRVQSGEAFDGVVLAADAIARLEGAHHVQAGSRVDLVRSGVAVAVREGAPVPDIGSEAALRDAVLAASSIGYSTGPSGTALIALFERWGIGDRVRDRLRQAPPGVPVGRMVAQGAVALGFQQSSELLGLPGIRLVGPLPAGAQITTTFSGAVCAASGRAAATAALLGWMASPDHAPILQRHGMEPAQ